MDLQYLFIANALLQHCKQKLVSNVLKSISNHQLVVGGMCSWWLGVESNKNKGTGQGSQLFEYLFSVFNQRNVCMYNNYSEITCQKELINPQNELTSGSFQGFLSSNDYLCPLFVRLLLFPLVRICVETYIICSLG